LEDELAASEREKAVLAAERDQLQANENVAVGKFSELVDRYAGQTAVRISGGFGNLFLFFFAAMESHSNMAARCKIILLLRYSQTKSFSSRYVRDFGSCDCQWVANSLIHVG